MFNYLSKGTVFLPSAISLYYNQKELYESEGQEGWEKARRNTDESNLLTHGKSSVLD